MAVSVFVVEKTGATQTNEGIKVVDGVQVGARDKGAAIDLVVQTSGTKVTAVYIRQMTHEVYDDLRGRGQFVTYLFKEEGVEQLAGRAMPLLSGVGIMPADERSKRLGRTLLQKYDAHTRAGVKQVLFEGRKYKDVEKVCERLSK